MIANIFHKIDSHKNIFIECACRSGGSGSSACSIQTALTLCNNWPEEEPGGDGTVVAGRKVDTPLLKLSKHILQKLLRNPVF